MSQQKPAKKAESTVVKPMAKKDRFKNLGGEIGNPPFPNGRKGMPYAPTKMGGAKNGKTMMKAKSGFAALAPPFDKATFADKIAGAKKNAGKAKSGTKMKKAQDGYTGEPGLLERTGPMRKTKVKERSNDGDYVKKTVTRTRKGATTTSSKTRRTLQGFMNKAPSVGSMKSGGTMKKCKTGCK